MLWMGLETVSKLFWLLFGCVTYTLHYPPPPPLDSLPSCLNHLRVWCSGLGDFDIKTGKLIIMANATLEF